MRDRYEEFRKRGAEVVAVGMGLPAMAEDFRDSYRIPFPVLIDQKQQTYAALGLRRGSLNDVIGPKMLLKGLRTLLHGHVAEIPKQDALQLGGAVVVAKGGDVRLVHRGETSADFPSVDKLLAAL